MTASARHPAAVLLDIASAAASWREDAACLGTGDEFVDVDHAAGRTLVAAYCRRCPVVGPCRALGDSLAPHPWPSVYGARVYERNEPAEGWPEVEEAAS